MERGEPVIFFCKLGKDRTGLISMLVLSCCRASEQEIISDYARCPARSSCCSVIVHIRRWFWCLCAQFIGSTCAIAALDILQGSLLRDCMQCTGRETFQTCTRIAA